MPHYKQTLQVLLHITLLITITCKAPKWSTLLSSTRNRGPVVDLLPKYNDDATESHLVVAFQSGEILDYNISNDRVHFLHSQSSPPPPPHFSANISSFGYLADLDIYYAGFANGDIWQLEPGPTETSWTVAISNTSYAPINLLLPFMKGGFFDLYFAAGNGELYQYNTFYDFGHVVYGGISTGQANTAVYTDYVSPADQSVVKSLFSGYTNGAVIRTTVGDGGAPITTILRALGRSVQKMLVYKNYQQNLLIVATNGPQAQITIFKIETNSVLFETGFYVSAIQDMVIYSDLVSQSDYLVFGFSDGSVLRFVISKFATEPTPTIETLVTPELFGGFPITSIKYNWLADSTGALIVATQYGTISALLSNDTDWKMLASPLSWETAQHISRLDFVPSGKQLNYLISLLDEGEISALNAPEWSFLANSPSQSETRFKQILFTQLAPASHLRIPKYSPTGPISFSLLQALVINNVAFSLQMDCLGTSCATSQFQFAVLGYDIYSQSWRQDGQNIIVTSSVTGLQQSVLYNSLSGYTINGDTYAWSQTTF